MPTLHHITEPIIYTASRLESIANRYIFEPMGTSVASMKILRVLKNQKKEMTPKEILDLVGGTKSNISQRIDFLERSGFIKRIYARYEQDKRKVAIAITPAGVRKMTEVDNRLRLAQLTLERSFSEHELKEAFKFFQKVNQVIDQQENNLSEIFNK